MKKLAVLVVVAPAAAFADDSPQSDLEKEIVSVASRRDTPASSVTSAVRKYDVDDFDRRNAFSIGDVLRETPGAYVSPDGPPGQFTRVFLRGAGSNQTLVLVDGIPQNDATAGGLFDFGDLGMTGVERVEVLRGSYSVLYGSEAIGGVVNVTTRRGHGPASGYVLGELGSFWTRREESGVSWGDQDLDFAFAVGDSAASAGHDRDDSHSHDAVGRFGVALAKTLRFDGSLRAVQSMAESPFDFASSGKLPADDDIGRRRRTLSAGGTLTWDAAEWLVVRGTGSAFDVDSDFDNGPDGKADLRDELDSHNVSADRRARLEATATLMRQGGSKVRTGLGFEVTAGGEFLKQSSRSSSSFPNFGAPGSSTSRSDMVTRTTSGFAQAQVSLPDCGGDNPCVTNSTLTLGTRHDHHSVFGSENSPYVGGRCDVFGTTLRSSYGEGFRAPKPSELFDPFIGRADLRPETSKSFDVGASRHFFDGALAAGVTWFRLDVDDLIAYDASTFHLENFTRTRTTGFEWEAAADLGDGFTLRGTLTNQNPRDRESGKPLANRARTFGSAGIEWRDEDVRISLDGFFSGANPDQGGEFTSPDRRAREHPGRRTIVDFSVRVQVDENVQVFGGIRNLLDNQWVATPNSPAGTGIGVYVGARVDF